MGVSCPNFTTSVLHGTELCASSATERRSGSAEPLCPYMKWQDQALKVFYFSFKKRTTAEVRPALQISLSAQDETKQPYSPLIAFLPGVILPLQISYCIAGLLFFFLAGGQGEGRKW